MRLYNTPLTSGSDDYGNELAIEWGEDNDVSANAFKSLLPTTPPPTLATLADIARTTLGTVDESPAAAHGSLQPGAKAKVLKVRSGWWPI
jgi:hypothetical protein